MPHTRQQMQKAAEWIFHLYEVFKKAKVASCVRSLDSGNSWGAGARGAHRGASECWKGMVASSEAGCTARSLCEDLLSSALLFVVYFSVCMLFFHKTYKRKEQKGRKEKGGREEGRETEGGLGRTAWQTSLGT